MLTIKQKSKAENILLKLQDFVKKESKDKYQIQLILKEKVPNAIQPHKNNKIFFIDQEHVQNFFILQEVIKKIILCLAKNIKKETTTDALYKKFVLQILA